MPQGLFEVRKSEFFVCILFYILLPQHEWGKKTVGICSIFIVKGRAMEGLQPSTNRLIFPFSIHFLKDILNYY